MKYGAKMTIEHQKKFLINTAYYTVLVIIVILALKLLTGILFPFAAALFLTLSLQSIIDRLVNKFHIKRKPASVLTVTVVFFFSGLVLFWLFKALYRQFLDFITALPSYSEQITSVLDTLKASAQRIFGNLPFFDNVGVDNMPSTALTTVTEKLTAGLTTAATDFAAGIPKFLFSLLVTIIASVYFAKDLCDIKDFLKQRLPEKPLKLLNGIKETLMTKTAKLIKGYSIIIAFTFLELSLGLLVLKVKYALVIAAIIAVIDILPVLGSGTVLIPWAIISSVTGNTALGIGLIILYIVITAVRNISEPKIIGDKIGLHPLLLLTAVFLGLRLFGAVGILVAPLAAVTAKALFDKTKSASRVT